MEVKGGIVTQLGAQMQRSRLSRDLQGTVIADLPIQNKVTVPQHAQDQREKFAQQPVQNAQFGRPLDMGLVAILAASLPSRSSLRLHCITALLACCLTRLTALSSSLRMTYSVTIG